MPNTGESRSGGHTVAIVDQMSELRQTVPADYHFNPCWCERGVSPPHFYVKKWRDFAEMILRARTVSREPGPGR